jgi:hypothetical protein
MKTKVIKNCDDCPCLYRESEYPETICKLSLRNWGMGYHRRGDPVPDWCPLKQDDIKLVLQKT